MPDARGAEPELGPGGAGRPLEEHPVEVQVQPADRRIVAGVLGLLAGDLGDRRQRVAGDEQAPFDPAKPGDAERLRERPEGVGVEERVAAADEREVAPERPRLDRPGGPELGAEPVAGAERLERVERGEDLGDRRRRQGDVRAMRLDQPAVELGEREAGQRPEPRARQDRVERGRRGRADGGRRQPGRGARQHRAPPDRRHRRHLPAARSSVEERSSIGPESSVQAGGVIEGQHRRLPLRHPPAGEAARRRREPGLDLLAGAGEHPDRHLLEDRRPAVPMVEAPEVVRPHQPDEAHARVAAPQLAQGRCGVARADPRLEVGDDDPPVADHRPRLGEPPREVGGRVGLQRVAGGDEPPDAIEPEGAERPERDVDVPGVRRVERAAEQPDALSGHGVGSDWRHGASPAAQLAPTKGQPATPVNLQRGAATRAARGPRSAELRRSGLRGPPIVAFSIRPNSSTRRRCCNEPSLQSSLAEK